MTARTPETFRRVRIEAQGIVQGVGFRPFVYVLARDLGLRGSVLNNSAGVTIEVEGEPEAIEAFKQALVRDHPPLARIDNLTFQPLPLEGDVEFVIAHSRAGAERGTLVSPDSATCPDCLREVLNPVDRRYGYPFTNCTNCGPRFTIVTDVPYDRANTTMSAFPMCDLCTAEYRDPLNRRFHAQPNACPICGPSLMYGVTREGERGERVFSFENPDILMPPLNWAAARLAGGDVLAVKGLGGYHLACDALNAEAVARLRRRKHREEKPFALMTADLETARLLCHISAEEETILTSHRRPIVLLRRRADSRLPLAPEVAPAYTTLGIMLPYTPMHHLLLRAFAQAKAPRGDKHPVLVMTSGNMSDEPIAFRDSDAEERLAPIAEGVLSHNRGIHIRCDDSVVRVAEGGEQIFRRSRGYAPEPVPLPFGAPLPLLACGGHLKNTFCLAKGRQAFVSHHIGDLENVETLMSFREGITHLGRLFDITPQAVAYDLHPEYLATKYALELDLPLKIGVQHHHAHIASVIAEHGLEGAVIGVAADGTGYGTDGAVWGCEVMLADLFGFRRLSHLKYVPLPGGERAVREPWRMAAVYLQRLYGDEFLSLDIPFVQEMNTERWRPLSQMIKKGINSPLTSSLGRLFDAAAALLGVQGEALYEGQAAIELETLAVPSADPYPWGEISHAQQTQAPNPPGILDVTFIRGMVDDVKRGRPTAEIAGRFHRTVAEMLATACEAARAETGESRVALSGGVFQNRLLLEQLLERLRELGFTVYINRRVPPNDGGISYGQAAVALAQIRGAQVGTNPPA